MCFETSRTYSGTSTSQPFKMARNKQRSTVVERSLAIDVVHAVISWEVYGGATHPPNYLDWQKIGKGTQQDIGTYVQCCGVGSHSGNIIYKNNNNINNKTNNIDDNKNKDNTKRFIVRTAAKG